MENMLSILTIAALTATMTTADFLAFTQENFDDLGLTDTKGGTFDAGIINLAGKIELRRIAQKENEIEFEESKLLYDLSKVHDDICQHFVGVYIKEKKLCGKKETFCKLRKLTMKLQENKRGEKYIELILFMDFEGRESLALHVPILQEPFPLAFTLLSDGLIKYIKDNNVSLWEPLIDDLMKRALESRPISPFMIEFSWLSNLLPHGVMKSSTRSLTPETLKSKNYTTRPIVVAERFLKLYADVITSS